MFVVEHDDRIGGLPFPAGSYQLTSLASSCRQNTASFRRLLARAGQTLPSPWQLNAQTGTFSTSAGARFRVKELRVMSAITDRTLLGASRDTSRALLGPVMGFVASTVAFAGLGAYLGRDLSGGGGLVFFLAAFACILGLNAAAAHQPLAIVLLFTLGLLLGIAVAPTLAAYGDTDPAALWQAAGATAAFVAALGSYGYATRRDLSGLARSLFWALLALIVFGLVAIFVSIPVPT